MIDVAELPRGMYVLDIRGDGDTRMVRKIVLQ
jgi:hypothetical protein